MHADDMFDWQRLDLAAPTADPAVIKRAYAIKLRQTRPDDDAAAYQALRESYDRLMRWARIAGQDTSVDQAVTALNAPAAFGDTPSGVADVVEVATEESRAAPEAATAPQLMAKVEVPPASAEGREMKAPSQHVDVPGTSASPGGSSDAPNATETAAEEAATEKENAATEEVAANAPTVSAAAPALPIMTPTELCALLLDAHQRGGDAMAIALMPELAQRLDALPLNWSAEATVRFADLVIAHPSFPLAVLWRLNTHFDWLADFRTARILGDQRWQALEKALPQLERPVSMAERHTVSDALLVGALARKGSNWRAVLVAALLSPLVLNQIKEGPVLLRRLGFDSLKVSQICATGDWLIFVVLSLAVSVARLPIDKTPLLALIMAPIFLLVYFAGTGAVVKGISAINRLKDAAMSAAFRRGLRVARWSTAVPWWGTGLLMIATAGFGVKAMHYQTNVALDAGSMACLVVGITLVLPAMIHYALIGTALWLFTAVATNPSLAVTWSASAIWVFGSMQLFLQGRHRPFVAAFKARGSARLLSQSQLAPLVLGLAGIPMIATRAAANNMRMVSAALCLAWANLAWTAPEPQRVTAWVVLLIAAPALPALQRRAIDAGRKLGRRWTQ